MFFFLFEVRIKSSEKHQNFYDKLQDSLKNKRFFFLIQNLNQAKICINMTHDPFQLELVTQSNKSV